MTHVLIAVDDSETSMAAARCAHALFGDDARYTLLCVADVPPSWGDEVLAYGAVYPLSFAPGATPMPLAGAHPGDRDLAPSGIAERTAATVAQAADLPDAATVGDIGDPAHVVVETAHLHGADVIVVGASERGWWSRLLTPSVASAVVRDADIPVLVAK